MPQAERLPLSPFPTTQWSMVCRAGMSDSVRRRVLAALITAYLPALRSFLLARHRLPPDRADDMLQGFVADKVLAQDLVRRADRQRGQFRTFLMAALERFVIDQSRRARAAKRSPEAGQQSSLDSAAAELDSAAAPAAADQFDAAWARQVLELSVARVREDCEAGQRPDLWAAFDGRVLGPTLRGEEPVPLAALVERLGLTPERASNLLVTSKRMFARHLRAVVEEYADGEDVDDEIRFLRSVLSGIQGG
jgi:DNA-directed RNA polymerase specialized sigma24 family protein